MPMGVVGIIKINSISLLNGLHNLAQRGIGELDDKVKVIVHKAIRMDFKFKFAMCLSKNNHEFMLVNHVMEYWLFSPPL